jgi:hypothetical protein
MERHVYRVSMIEPQAIMGHRLTKGSDGQSATERLQKKLVDLRGIR